MAPFDRLTAKNVWNYSHRYLTKICVPLLLLKNPNIRLIFPTSLITGLTSYLITLLVKNLSCL